MRILWVNIITLENYYNLISSQKNSLNIGADLNALFNNYNTFFKKNNFLNLLGLSNDSLFLHTNFFKDFNFKSDIFLQKNNNNSIDLSLDKPNTASVVSSSDIEESFYPELNLNRPMTGWGEKHMDNYVDYAIYMFERELDRRHKERPDLTRKEMYDLWTGLGMDSCEYNLSQPLYQTDYTNLFDYNGHIIDVSKLNSRELTTLMLETDDMSKFEKLESLAHVKSLYHYGVPQVKLYYPEPFIASPSFIHNDIGFIHILQYQFWLWFVFIFMIVFFFLSFLCVARWCSMRNQPRRETRGVSRSKCGDLITACVPVTWAVSIIVSESTDAMDIYDGFGASEILIGIRAYQWGWEYYYPKSIDLQYNVRPSYSTFIGNSLKYNSSSEKTLNTNQLWKFYQNKKEDLIVTPAHLLTVPLDNNKVFNFMNFKNIGASTAQESAAFKKVRMHSKTYNTNLVHTPTTFTNKYIKLNSLYSNENSFHDSLNYGLKRQHNLTSVSTTTSTYSTFLDQKSMDKFLTSNLQYNSSKEFTNIFYNNLNVYSKPQVNDLVINSLNKSNLLLTYNNLFNSKNFVNLLTHPNIILELNDDSDKTNIKLPIRKLLNKAVTRNDLIGNDSIINSLYGNFTTSTVSNVVTEDLSNKSTTSKLFKPLSETQSILPSDQSVRKYSKLQTNNSNLNLSLGLNSLYSNLKTLDNNVIDFLPKTNLNVKSNWADFSISQKLANNSFFFEAPYSPVVSNNPYLIPLDYDTTTTKTITNKSVNNKIVINIAKKNTESVSLLMGRRENALKALSTSYWQMFWSNSNSDLRVNSAVNSSLNSDLSYIPLFTNYYDYDFRNAQALELLENCFWDTSYSNFSYNDYLNINDNFNKNQDNLPRLSRRDFYYHTYNIGKNINNSTLTSPLSKDLSLTGNFYSNNIQSDDYISPLNLLNTKDFFLFPLVGFFISLDDTYSNYKNLLTLYNKNSSFFFNLNLNYTFPQSYIEVLNNFRADFEDFSWYSDLNLSDITKKPSFNLNNLDVNNSDLELNSNLPKNNISRFSNPITLRSTSRNSIVTYNALQKVFKARFEDGRSNTKITSFGNLGISQPFITGGRISYEKLLGKNKDNYYNTTFYKNSTFKVFNDLSSNSNSLNYYFFDFPFLMSAKSDPSRFVWFDWFSKWSVYEVQPSSVSRYSTIGVPYNKKNFDFNIENNEVLGDSETYFTRISRSRKNYLPNWLYTPYLYSRSNVWLNSEKSNMFVNNDSTNISNTSLLLNNSSWFWKSLYFINNTSSQFTPSHSGDNIYAKSVWRPYNSVSAYYYHTSNLVDILTKREYLYRQYLESNNRVINLPNIFTSNPNNPLLSELKSSFLFVDPITYNSEYSRELYYNSLSFFKFMLLKNCLLYLNNFNNNIFINTDIINNYLFYYFFSSDKSNKVGNNNDLYKNQHRPLRKGLSTMLRLHATGAVAMPTEIRLQILASSRDVIHSWSVPSAGVKIDCVPGYTSHRIMIFFNSGIYWGQCQEICGRYHHWMPIVVYFMKRDLFFLWCTHFMYNSGVNDTWEINDRQFVDYIKFASYDQHTWLTELEKFM